MEYKLLEDRIEIFGKEDFNIAHILECGQVFSYTKNGGGYTVFSKDKKATIVETAKGFVIYTDFPEYFEHFFDLKTNYGQVKNALSEHKIMQGPIKFGYGIRILRQDLFETMISFIVSANNNIKRIQLILNRIRQKFGSKKGDYYAFPTQKQLLKATEADFLALGAGYRAKYLYKVVRQIDENALKEMEALPTPELRKRLVALSGVGPKVADCILLFGFHRGDVFPVDTWIEKMYIKFYSPKTNLTREKIRSLLTDEFGELSGYAQQYLFYYMRLGQ